MFSNMIFCYGHIHSEVPQNVLQDLKSGKVRAAVAIGEGANTTPSALR